MKVKRLLVLLALFFHIVSVFSQSENTETIFNKLVDNSLELIDNRKLDSAKVLIDKSEKLLSELKADSTFLYKQQIASAALKMRQGDNQNALKVFLKALPYFEKNKDLENVALTYYQLAICHYFLNMRSVSEDFFIKSSELGDYLPERIQTKVLQNLGTINLEEGMAQKNPELFRKAIANFEKASTIYIEQNKLTELALCQSLLGEAYIQLKEYPKAIEIINKAIEYSIEADSKEYRAFALIKKSSVLGKTQNYYEAIKAVNEAITIYKITNDKASLSYGYQEKKKYLEATQQFEAASKIGDSLWSLTVDIYNNRVADAIAEMETKYKTAEQEREIAEQKLEIQNKNIFGIILGGSLIILSIIIIGLYKKQQFKQKQFQKEMELKDHLSQIKTANQLQEQRLEISRDLHDNIGAQLTFIISSIDNLRMISKETSNKFKEKLSSISSFTGETIGQLRDTIWAMNKDEISFEDLYGRLLSYVEKVKEITTTPNITLDNEVENRLIFSSVVGMNLFRVVQESINNGMKHSEASDITIQFKLQNSALEISIADNGKGFNKNDVLLGNGLSNIEERINSINGTAEIISEISKGTQILIKLPL